jgi:hypothetical protein
VQVSELGATATRFTVAFAVLPLTVAVTLAL